MKTKKVRYAQDVLKKFVPRIDAVLKDIWEDELSDIEVSSPKIKIVANELLSHAQEHNLRKAKRLRAAFVYYCYRLLQPEGMEEEILKTSAFMEIIHSALLMHDDFMDQDNMRRGGETTHEHYKRYHEEKLLFGDAEHFGNSLAVDVGDGILTLGYRHLNNSPFPAELKIRVLNVLFENVMETVYGQAYDLMLESSASYKEQDVIDLHCAKTSVYTYRTPSIIGAALAGGTQKDIDLISKYALPGGIAFQIQDDVLGLFGDVEVTGKPNHADLRQGKKTLLIIKALEVGTKAQIRRIMEVWGNPNISDKDADDVRVIVKKTGALKHSTKVAQKFARDSQKFIPAMRKKGWTKESIDFLDGIADYMATEREV